MKYDLWYIENWSMKLDMQIILMTIWQMITGDTKAV
jgi:lipopolysaccharide/colanic/teichoic acid biosynthesis glycosyltransferase